MKGRESSVSRSSILILKLMLNFEYNLKIVVFGIK